MSRPAFIRPVVPVDLDSWVRLRGALWPGDTLAEHRRAADRFFAGHRHEPAEVLVGVDSDGRIVGFVELSIRNIVESCETDRVGYLEGWYVEPDVRRRGIGRQLMAAAERWAVDQGCTEFASDAELHNEASHEAHRALGFSETSRVVNFRKQLPR